MTNPCSEQSLETRHILKKDGIANGQQTSTIITTKRKYLIGPLIFFSYCTYGIFLYSITEYTQHAVREETIRNTTLEKDFQNFSVCDANKSSVAYITYIEIQRGSSKWMFFFALSLGIPSLVSSLILGSYSDAFGRRSIMLVSISGELFKVVVSSIMVYYKVWYTYFIIAFIVEGITGQYMSFGSSSLGYIADITAPGKERSFGMILNELLKGLSLTTASFCTGYAIKSFGFFYPMVVAAAILFINLLLILFVLPETLLKEQRRTDRSIKETARSSIKFYVDDSYRGKRWKYIILFLCFLAGSVGVYGRQSMEALYQLGPPFCLSADEVGLYGSAQFLGSSLVGMSLGKLLQRCLADDTLAVLSALSGGASMVMLALATSEIVLYLVPAVNCLSIFTFAMIRTLMSEMTPPDSQGALFAGLGTAQTVSNLIGTAGGNAVYFATIHILNGFVFLVVAALFFITCILLLMMIFVDRRQRRQQKYIKLKSPL